MGSPVLEDRVAVVTGGSRGIGRAIGRALAGQGADVALLARTSGDLSETADAIARDTGRRAIGITADVTQWSDIQAALQTATAHLGRLDILVACAGGGTVGGTLDVPDAAWEEQIRLKLLGYIRCAREAVPYMRQSGGGAIVLIGGGSAHDPSTRLAIASVMNAGLLAFTKTFADEVAQDRIRIVMVNPGLTETGLIDDMAQQTEKLRGIPAQEAAAEMRAPNPLGRVTLPEDVASLVTFLASDEAAMITGTSIDIDAGARRGLA
ncbi:MAG: SDR family oxidoreductase [Chloroflexota bacterium]|nr:SDR family oxidoreductase [Chloroflexota bacterium]